MIRALYEGNETVPVGFPNTASAKILTANTASGTFSGDVVLRVTPISGGVWVAIGADPTATADADGNHYIEQTQDIGISKGDKIISTGSIQITPFK